jgi:hypothetical protein
MHSNTQSGYFGEHEKINASVLSCGNGLAEEVSILVSDV